MTNRTTKQGRLGKWRACAAKLGHLMPVEMLDARALAALRQRPRGETVAVACSGGADSVALLLLLWAHLPERRGGWRVLHFDHRLRGRASAADAAFVRKLARGLGERCAVGHWNREHKERERKPSENDARDARWKFFGDAMRRSHVRVIALGHQLNDIAETMLMRLTRGSGAAGLAAPRPVQSMADGTVRIRPLLRIPADRLRGDLQGAGANWREDATNASDDFLRNRVRRRVVPELAAAAGQNVLTAIADARGQLEEDDNALEIWLGELVGTPVAGEPYDLSALRHQPTALIRRAVHRWCLAVGLTPPPRKAAIDLVVGAVVEGETRRLSAGTARFIVVDRRTLSLAPAGDVTLPAEPWRGGQLDIDHELVGPRGDRLALSRVRLTRQLYAQIRRGEFAHATTVFLDPGAGWSGWFRVRSWQPGDRYRPLGAPGRAKLQDLFVNHRIPQELRRLLPVVEQVNEGGLGIRWVPGLPPAQEVAIQPAAKVVVQLTYTPAPPMVHRSKAHTSQDV